MHNTTKDQLGRTVVLPNWPFRIISLIPSETELIVDLGLEEFLVGVTKFCVHPKHLKSTKTIVGGTKKVSFEKIAELKPNIILCNKEENTKEIVHTLEKEYAVHVSDVKNVDDVYQLLKNYSTLFNCSKKALEIESNIQRELYSFSDFMANKPKINVWYFIWKNPWMVAGKDTFINSLLALNGFNNLCEEKSRYPEISLETVKLHPNTILLLSSEPFPFTGNHRSELKDLGIPNKTILVDGEYFSWYGSRLQAAFAYFKKLHTSI